MQFDRLILEMRRLALEAGARIMEIYDGPDVEGRAKADASPVTAADEAADALISAGLRAAFPDVPLVTEEQAATHGQSLSTFLIVDPLDGTKEFVNRRGDFTVNIAYVQDGVPVRGVVYAPARGRLFYTSADGRSVEEAGPFGAQIGSIHPIGVNPMPDNRGLMVVASKSHRDQATERGVQGAPAGIGRAIACGVAGHAVTGFGQVGAALDVGAGRGEIGGRGGGHRQGRRP